MAREAARSKSRSRAHSGGEAEAGGNQGENVGGLHFDSRNWGQKGIREMYSWIFELLFGYGRDYSRGAGKVSLDRNAILHAEGRHILDTRSGFRACLRQPPLKNVICTCIPVLHLLSSPRMAEM